MIFYIQPEILHVNAAKLTGPIRDSFETFTSLKYVDFSTNELTGPIPSSIFGTTIELFYLSENAFSGSIPPSCVTFM
jgi:hypothetical protein